MMTSLMCRRLLSFGLYAGLARQRGPFWDLSRDIGGELDRAVADRFGTLFAQALTDIGQRERRNRSIVQPRRYHCRRAGGGKQRVRIVSDQLRKTRLRGGGDLGHHSAA